MPTQQNFDNGLSMTQKKVIKGECSLGNKRNVLQGRWLAVTQKRGAVPRKNMNKRQTGKYFVAVHMT